VAPPPLAPPPAPAAGAVAPHITRPKAKLNYTLQKLTAPTAISKNVSVGSEDAAEAAPDLGGVPRGVLGGAVGGVIGGVLGGTGTVAPTRPPAPRPVQKVVRVGGNVKAPRQPLVASVRNVEPQVYLLLQNEAESRCSTTDQISRTWSKSKRPITSSLLAGIASYLLNSRMLYH
jgi:hypothetical protein